MDFVVVAEADAEGCRCGECSADFGNCEFPARVGARMKRPGRHYAFLFILCIIAVVVDQLPCTSCNSENIV